MPSAVAATVTFLKTVGLAVGGLTISGGTALAIGAATVVAGAIAAQKLISSLYSVPSLDSDSSRQATVRGTVEPQKLIYGEALVSGPISFVGVAGTDNRDLYHSIVLAGHPSDSISDIYFDDERIQSAHINGSGNVTTGVFGPKDGTTICVIRKLTGGQTTADSVLDGAFNTINSSEHIGTNLTYIVTKFTLTENSQETWDKFLPNDIKALVKGKKVYDPRQDSTSTHYDASVGVSTQRSTNSATWAWSDNPVWCLVDYLTDDRFGMDIDLDRIDLSKAVDAADICDVAVSVPGGGESRYTCNGVIFGTATHKANINKILSSMNGMLTYTNGKYVIRAGAFESVGTGMTLTEDHMTGPVKLKTSFERNERFNTITGTFVDPEKNFKEIEFPKVQITSALTRDNSEELTRELKLSMTNSRYMAQRIAHKLIQLSDLQKVLTFPTNLAGVNISVGDRVNVTLSEFGYTNKTFVCLGWTLSESGSGGVNLTLREDDSSSYSDLAVSGYSTVTPAGGIQQGFFGVPDPSGLSATAHVESIELDWTNPANMTGIIAIEVFASPNSSWSSAVKIGETIGTQFVHDESNGVDPIVENDQRYYWVRARRFPSGEGSDAVSDRNPDSDTSTIQATKGALGDLSGLDTVGDSQIDDNAVTNRTIADDAVDTDQINDGAVDTDQIANDAVDITKIANTLETTNFSTTNGTGWQIKTDGTATFNDVNVRGEVVATQLNVQDATISGSLKANELSDGIVKITSVSQEVWNEIESRVGSTTGSTGFFEAASGNLTGGDLTLTTASTKAHATGQTVYFELDAVYFWSSATSVSGNDLLLDVKFQHSTDNVTYTTVNTTQITVERHNYFNGFMYDIDNSVQYQLTGLAAGNYYFRVSLEPVGATPNAFSIAYLGVPVSFEVNEIGTGSVSTGGNADTLDNLDSTAFLRSNTNDTFDGDLTITGQLILNGSIDQYNVTDLDVTDKTITVNSGNTQSLSDGAGLIVDRGSAADASITWDETNDKFTVTDEFYAPTIAGDDLVLREWTGNSAYGSLAHKDQSGVEYMIISQDNHTFISATTGYDVKIRGGNNTSTHEIVVYPDQDATASGNKIWHGGDFTSTNISNWNTAYTYSQVGHLPLAGGALTGALTTTGIDINGSSGDSILRINPNNGSSLDAVAQWNGNAPIGSEGFEIWYDNSVGDVHLHTTYNNPDAAIRFHTRTGTSKATSNERFVISGDGDFDFKSGDFSNVGAIATSGDITVGSNRNINLSGDLKMTGTDSYIWVPNTSSGFTGFYSVDNGVVARYENNTNGWGFMGSPEANYAVKVHGALYATTDIRFDSALKLGANTVIASTRRFYASNGTSSKAAYSFDGDSGTGISRTAAGRIDFLSSGVVKAYIRTGTTNPISDTMYVDGQLGVNGQVVWSGGTSANANAAYGWGDHSTQGYLTAEADTLATVTGRGATTTNAISTGAITSSGTSTLGNLRLTDSSRMGFGTVKAGGSVGHNSTDEEGIFWHTDNVYGIYRTSGTWASPNYQQLKLRWATGIELDGGTAYGKSGVNIVNGSDLQMGGTTFVDSSRNITAGTISSGAITSTGNISIPVASKLYFDGGVHTYISEDIDDRLRFFVGGAEFMRFTETTSNLVHFYQNVSTTGNLVVGGDVTATGYLQATSYLYTRNDLRVLNAAGTGWTTWGTRSNGNYNLNVGTISSGAITATGNITTSGSITSTGTFTSTNLAATGTVSGDQFRASLGTQSAPAYTFKNDDDTGFYGGGNTVYGVTGGQKRLTLNASGVSAHNDLIVLTGKLKFGTVDVIDASRNISASAITATTLKETDGGDGFTEIGSSNFGYFSWGVEIANPSAGYRAIRFAGKKKYFVLEADVLGTSNANHTGMFWGNADGTSIYAGSTTGYKTTHQNTSSFHIRDINGNANQETYNPGFSPSDGAWHHQKIAATPDGYVRVWIDGDLKFEETGYIPSAAGYLGFINYQGTLRFANIRCRTINEDESQHFSNKITSASAPYASGDRFIKIANNTASAAGTLVTADNGNTWLNADGGKDLWLNWYSLNSPASKADLQVGNGSGGASILTVAGTNNRVGINDSSPSFSLDVNGSMRITGDALTSTLSVGSQIGSRSNALSVDNNDNSSPIAAKSEQATVFSVLPWDSGETYIASGIYYDDGSWVHASANTKNCLLRIGGDKVSWYSSDNSSGSWNVASDQILWDSTGVWKNAVDTGSAITSGGAVTAGNGSTSLGYYVGTTQVIQGSTRNLLNIGTASLGKTTIKPSGYINSPTDHAALNIGRASGGETRAIDIWGDWSSGESKSITANYGTSTTAMVGQINFAHKPTSNTTGSSIRFGKLFHGGDSSLYTMELHSESTSLGYLNINRDMVQLGQDSTYTGTYATIGFGGRTNGYNRVFGSTGTADGLFLASATGRGVFVRTNGASTDTFSFTAAGAFQVAGTTVIDSSRNITAGAIAATSVDSGGAVTGSSFTADQGNRTVAISNGTMTMKGSTGGWAFGLYALGSSNTNHGGFGFYGGADAFTYYYIGASYNNPTNFRFYKSGQLNIGTNTILDSSRNLTNIGTISSGAITSSGSVTATTINNATGAVLNLGNSTYTIINNPENSVALYLGDSADRSNYYQNNVHHFRHTNATTYYLSLDGTGANIRSGGLQISGTETISSTRRFYASNGTSVKAAYSFSDETNTGWYKPAAGEIKFIGQSVERLHITSSGEVQVTDGQLRITNDATSVDALIMGSGTQTAYTNVIWSSNSGTAQIWKAGSLYTSYGGTSAMNIYNSNGKISFHPFGTANVVEIDASSLALGAGKTIRMLSTSSTLISHGSYTDAIGYNASYGTYIGAGSRYVYSGSSSTGNGGSHPYYSNGATISNITHDAGQINNSYAGQHYINVGNTGNGGLRVSGSATSGPQIGILSTATGGTQWQLISNGSGNTDGAGRLQIWNSTNSHAAATFGQNGATPIKFYNNKFLLAASNIGIGKEARPEGAISSSIYNFKNGLFWHNNSSGDYGIFRTADGWSSPTYSQLRIQWTTGIILDGGSAYGKSGVNIVGGSDLQMNGTTVIDSSTNGVFNNLRADGGNLIMGDEAYSTSADYVGMKTSNMSGSSDYMIISGLSDGNTYLSAKNGAKVFVRGGGNNGSNELEVTDSTFIRATTSNFYCTGNVTAFYSSDKSLKENIRVIDRPIEKIKQIRGVYFDWTDDYIKGQSGDGQLHVRKDDVGIIAQEVKPVLDEVVTTREDGTLAVRYEKMVALCIEAIKEQQDQIDSLKTIIEEMKNGNN